MAHSALRRITATTITSMAVIAALMSTTPAQAGIAPADPNLPATVTADGLPTVQIDGVVWDQEIVGNTVYVGGQFTNARPAGAAPGVNTVSRSNLLAYDLRTGNLINSWSPTANAQIKSISSSADGSTIYVAGSFTQIDGENRGRIAALDAGTGALQSTITTGFDATINSVHWTPDAIYVGGVFSRAGSTSRIRAAAISPVNGAVLPFNPSIPDGNVQAVVTSPDNSKVVLGGAFSSVNGSRNPGYGLVMLDPATGRTNLPLAANNQIRNAGKNSAILALAADADGFYGVGYHFGRGGSLEGSFQADWNGALVWVEDCHGDTYDIVPVGDVVYSASHKHYCGNLGTGGFPQTTPWSYYRGTAATKFATGISKPDIYDYPDHPGQPSNTLLNWFPSLNAGTYTGQNQGPWDVEANDEYVVMGGEFTRVNFTGQQGLVRFAVKDKSPQGQGPRSNGADLVPSVRSMVSGAARISWPAMWDFDNATLTYRVFRDTSDNPVHEEKLTARFWEATTMGWTDRGLTPGSTVRYRVQAEDSSGNKATSPWVNVTIASNGTLGDYAETVLDDGPSKYWRLNETNRSVFDWAGSDDTQTGSGATRNQSGALNNHSDASTKFNGWNTAVTVSKQKVTAPDTFSMETWFKTSNTGKIAGFGSAASGDSASFDRHLYMDTSGRVTFGTYNGTENKISSGTGYNNNQWHHVVGTMSDAGMVLYVDGNKIGALPHVTKAESTLGYWRIGGDRTWSGNKYFNGLIDEFAIYPRALSLREVNDHWMASGRASALPTAPADDYGKAVFNDNPDLYWRLAETSGTTATDSSSGGGEGSYFGNKDLGRTGAVPGNTGVELQRPTTGFLGFGSTPGGNVVANQSAGIPDVFSQEVWLKTSTTDGGRIFGYGSASNGSTSSSYDRQLQLLDNGKVQFGVYNGDRVVIDSQNAVNDGEWHHIVSTLGTDGMKLYVDGVLEGSDTNTAAQSYVGYWKLGGDKVWSGSTDEYLLGDFDEAAIYSRALTLGEIQGHYEASGRTAPNTAPVATFAHRADDLKVTFDSSGSHDAEGDITYAWDFGDGATSTKAKPDHTYAASGDYQVTLTVKDARGATDTDTNLVIVRASNQAPVASFTHQVDGLKVNFTSTAADPDGTIVSHDWDFGDGTTSTLANPSHTYVTGAVRTVTLTVTDDRGGEHTTTVSVDPDEKPTAAFTHTTSGLRAALTSTSHDDGAIVSHVWDFGDGTGSMQQSPIHDYATTGTYTVSLTITDDTGNTATTSKQVTVEPSPNEAPTAAFVYTLNGPAVAFDASSSSDPDGSIANYAWNFGDGGTATGRTVDHTFAESGTYEVRLTVKDDEDAMDAVTRQVTIVIPEAGVEFVKDDFGRNITNGWGTADVGGDWAVSSGATAFSVSDGAGQVSLGAGAGRQASLNTVTSDESDVTFEYTLEKSITGGGSSWLDIIGRQVDSSNAYRAKAIVNTSGDVRVDIVRITGGSSSTLGSTTVPGLTVAGGETLKVRVQTMGTSPTDIRIKVWKSGDEEPGEWSLARTDATGALQAAGGIGFYFYLSGSVANAPQTFTIDKLRAKTAGVVADNQAPLAEFTDAVDEDKVTVDASASVDPDGTIANYAWKFGDGASATGKTSEHTYTASGTYEVSLTVTDNDGATATAKRNVTVTVPAGGGDPDPDPGGGDPGDPQDPAEPVADDFGRDVARGWGTADSGGDWTVSGGSAAPFSVSDGAGQVSLAPGAGRKVSLDSVDLDSSDLTFDYSLSRAVASGASYLDIYARTVSGSDSYRGKVIVNSAGAVRVDLIRVVDGSSSTLGAMNVADLTLSAEETLKVRVQADGSSPTTLRIKVWEAGTTEPSAWTMERTDDAPVLQASGGLGFYFYLSGSAGPGPQAYSIDNLRARRVK